MLSNPFSALRSLQLLSGAPVTALGIKTPGCKSDLNCHDVRTDDPKGEKGKEVCAALMAETLTKTGSAVMANMCFASCARLYPMCYADDTIDEPTKTLPS